MTFQEAADQYLKEQFVRNTDDTYKQAKGYLERSCRYLGKMNVNDITRATLLDFIIHRRKVNPHVSNTTINKYIRHITVTLRNEADIHIKIQKLREPKIMPQVLTDDTITRTYVYLDSLEHEEAKRNRLMFMILLDTGMRIRELLYLKVSDINFENRYMLLKHTKSDVQRYVFFTVETSKHLESYIIRNSIRKYLMVSLETQTQLHPDSVQTICQRIQQKANLKQSVSPHKWRHTFATRFMEKNGNHFVLQKLLGHTDIKMTQRYVTVSFLKLKDEYTRVLE